MNNIGTVKLEILTNTHLDEISKKRLVSNNLVWRKKDIVAELIAKAHKKEV